ncbi:hypothetical protein Mycsm_07111 (plasmid) [Mycobacterium sp. JS623]|uniref:hypothetical protein n=1 Tax=Mycobacterium sp. JS623 TaxID=212767 RepID=UPI0002A5B9A3|nr:hypothetical protein [Mycobacterium sp. JS623]AGB27208.1 hypothetical protein Mycsm_07111 [Mycobacterium sp. JS623]
MTDDDRQRIDGIAEKNCWTVTPSSEFHGGQRPDGNEVVAYERFSTQILAEWTPQGGVASVVKNPHNRDEVRIQGAEGLLDLQTWLQERL